MGTDNLMFMVLLVAVVLVVGAPHLLPGLGSGTYSGAFALVFGNHALRRIRR